MALKEQNDYRVVTKLDDLKRFVDDAVDFQKTGSVPRLGFDFETTGLDVFTNRLCGWSMSYKKNHAIYVPVYHSQGELADEDKVVPFMCDLVTKGPFDITAHNLGFEYQHIYVKWKVTPVKLKTCSQVISWLDDPNRAGRFDQRSIALKEMAKELWDLEVILLEDLIDLKTQNFSFLPVTPGSVSIVYACQDADLCLRVEDKLGPKVRQEQPLVYKLEMELAPICGKMQMRGVKLNSNLLEEELPNIQLVILDLARETFEQMGFQPTSPFSAWPQPFDLSSPAKVSDHFFEVMGLPAGFRGKSGRPSVGKDELELLRDDYPVVGTYLDYKQAVHMRDNFITTLPNYVNALTGYIHGSFNQSGAPTGRFSHSKPNLAQIPKKRD